MASSTIKVDQFIVLRAIRTGPIRTNDVNRQVGIVSRRLRTEARATIRKTLEALKNEGLITFGCLPGAGCCNEATTACKHAYLRETTPNERALLRAMREHPAGRKRIVRVRTERKRFGGIRGLVVAPALDQAEVETETEDGETEADLAAYQAWVCDGLATAGRLTLVTA